MTLGNIHFAFWFLHLVIWFCSCLGWLLVGNSFASSHINSRTKYCNNEAKNKKRAVPINGHEFMEVKMFGAKCLSFLSLYSILLTKPNYLK